MIFGIPEELLLKEYDILGKTTDPDILFEARMNQIPEIFDISTHVPRSMTAYQGGKKTNHACNYWMTYRMFLFSMKFLNQNLRYT
jgi:hypothetical protein